MELRALNARSVILSTLLGTDARGGGPPRMPAARLVRAAALFGISEGTARTALSRMVTRGELEADGGAAYVLAGPLLARRARQDDSRRAERVEWNGRWRLAVVSAEPRAAADRSAMRAAMATLRMAELREGVWSRPDNLPLDRAPDALAVAGGQCTWGSWWPDEDGAELATGLWDLDGGAGRATELRREMAALVGRLDEGDLDALAPGFVLSAAVLRHFQADPLLPDELLDRNWPGRRLRLDYDRFDRAYRAVLRGWLVGDGAEPADVGT